MLNREEMHSGSVGFDVIVNGECIKKVKGGLLAHYDKSISGIEVITQDSGPEFIAHTVACLTMWLIKHNYNDLLVEIMEEAIDGLK